MVARTARLLGLNHRPARGLLLLLLLTTAALIVLHIGMKTLGPPMPLLDLGVDRGWGEFFQYVQVAWAAVMLLLLAVRERAGVYVAWLLACIVFAADDGLQLHERVGEAAMAMFPEAGMLANHLGELVWFAALGAVLVTLVAITHRRAAPGPRAVSAVLVALFSLVIFFGVVIDAIHHIFLEYPALHVTMTVIEDGGEIAAMSLVVAFLFAVAFLDHRPAPRGLLARLAGAGRLNRNDPGPADDADDVDAALGLKDDVAELAASRADGD